MKKRELSELIERNKSFLCVGLDPDLDRLPAVLLREEDPVFAFNKAVIDATRDHCVAYKPNTAFYECLGPKGWKTLAKTREYIGHSHFTIADAKRGDIGNTSTKYAEAFFKALNFDAVTVAPYMGRDSVAPFLEFEGHWAVVLALTSNSGALDFQLMTNREGEAVYLDLLRKSSSWGSDQNTMFVVGATRPEMIEKIREVVPDHFLLVPGVGAQGGSLAEVCKYGSISGGGLLVNASRSVLYASSGNDFAEAAGAEAAKLSAEMAEFFPQG